MMRFLGHYTRKAFKQQRSFTISRGSRKILALLSLVVTVLVITYFALSSLGTQEPVRMQGLPALWQAKSRFRHLCNLPITEWNSKQRLWIPPMCPYAVLYMGIDPATLAGASGDSEIRQAVEKVLENSAMHIHVKSETEIGSLETLLGSSFVDKHWPSVVAVENFSGAKSVMPADSAESAAPVESFKSFLTKVKNHEAQRYLKVEEVEHMPLGGGSNPEFTPMGINADFFDEYISNKTNRLLSMVEREFFVTFHAPWCGHCRVFLSKLEPLARALTGRSNGKTSPIGFYKLDVTANDILDPAYRITKVPTTMFFSADLSEPVEMTERREVRTGLIDFLHKHSKRINEDLYNEL